jgi:hypothetical protein
VNRDTEINQTNVQNIVNNVTNVTNINNQVVNNNIVNNFNNTNYVNNRPWHGSYDHIHDHWHGGYWNMKYRPAIWMSPSIGFNLGAAPVVNNVIANPYVSAQSTVVLSGYDYSHPIRPSNVEVGGRVTEEAIRRLDAARAAYRDQQYQRCLDLVDGAIRLVPDDSVIHELRALALFALGDYESAAAVVYSIVAAGPGSDWSAVSPLYESQETYLGQLRRLAQYVAANPDRTGPRFLIAYHLLMVGYGEAAYSQLNEVLQRRPDDRVAAELLRALSQQSTR